MRQKANEIKTLEATTSHRLSYRSHWKLIEQLLQREATACKMSTTGHQRTREQSVKQLWFIPGSWTWFGPAGTCHIKCLSVEKHDICKNYTDTKT